jgi:Transmembrane secretion effector
MTYNLARAVGPALAAVTVSTLGIPAAFAINSASYLALVAALLVVRARPQSPSRARSRTCARAFASSANGRACWRSCS